MRLLLVEDDENKRQRLVEYLSIECAGDELSVARSYHSGLKAILEGSPDLVLLDMTMPTFDVTVDDDGGEPQPFAGREILRQLEARGLETRCVVVTQFDHFGDGATAMTAAQLDESLVREHSHTYLGMVQFELTFGAWKESLAGIIERARGGR